MTPVHTSLPTHPTFLIAGIVIVSTIVIACAIFIVRLP